MLVQIEAPNDAYVRAAQSMQIVELKEEVYVPAEQLTHEELPAAE